MSNKLSRFSGIIFFFGVLIEGGRFRDKAVAVRGLLASRVSDGVVRGFCGLARDVHVMPDA
jgi:hypothetical protein